MATLNEIYAELKKYEIVRSKYQKASTLQKNFYCEGTNRSWLYRIKDKNKHKYKYGFTKWSITQLCTKMELCKKTYDKCARLFPKTVQGLMRKFLSKYKFKKSRTEYSNEMLIRYGKVGGNVEKVRAVLSINYSIYNNEDLLTFLERENIVNDKNILSYYVDDTVFQIIISVDNFYVGGELWKTGFRFVNSEVGKSRVRMEFFVYKVACSNGMIVRHYSRALVEHIHIGIVKKKLEDRIKEAYKNGVSITEMVKTSIEAELRNSLDINVQRTLKYRIDGYLNNIERQVVEEKMKPKVKNYYWYAYVISEIANGYQTIIGKEVKDVKPKFDKREKLQILAGRIISGEIF